MVSTFKQFVYCLLMTSVVKCNTQASLRSFNIKKHLSTRSRYAWAQHIPGAPSVHSIPDPDGYAPVHLYLVARHGTRWPTKKRMEQIDSLEETLKHSGAHHQFPWLRHWQAPFTDLRAAGGELHPIGEHELWSLGARLRQRFPSLLHRPYLPRHFPIVSTQVPRAAASASAFAHGFFPAQDTAHNRHSLHSDPFHDPTTPDPSNFSSSMDIDSSSSSSSSMDTGSADFLNDPNNMDTSSIGSFSAGSNTRPQPVAISMSPKKADPLLRFFDICPAFLHHEDYTERWLATWMTGTLQRLQQRLRDRLHLPSLNPRHTDGLWQLCQVEAGLEGRTDGACQLFTAQEIKLLEWVEDVRLWETQGHGADVNYRMAAPLLDDMLQSLGAAANSSCPEAAARLLFAHAETLVPLATLMGLFKEDALKQPPHAPIPEPQEQEFERGGHLVEERIAGPDGVDSLEDIPLAVHLPGTPPSGPHYFKGREAEAAPIPEGWSPSVPLAPDRMWMGSRVSPFGANLAVVLYRKRSGGTRWSDHIVRLMYNEQIISLPGCRGQIDCPLDAFIAALRPSASADNMNLVCGAHPNTPLTPHSAPAYTPAGHSPPTADPAMMSQLDQAVGGGDAGSRRPEVEGASSSGQQAIIKDEL